MNKKLGLTIYSLGHLLVDGACCLVVLVSIGAGQTPGKFAAAVIVYNMIAFALQPFFGLYTDKKGYTNVMAFVGCVLVGASAFLMNLPYAAAVTAGLGNAMYHIGGGSYSLNLDRGRAAWAGVFVAPGAIGLFLGAFLAGKAHFQWWYVLIPMVILGIAVLTIRHIPHEFSHPVKQKKKDFSALPLLLLSLVIALRSVIGSVGVFPWKNTQMVALLFVITVALGKAAGGFLADWIGRKNTAVIALVLSAPLLAFFEAGMIASFVGLFLFNLTMAVTLTEIADQLQGYSGFAFGLTTLALIFGTFLLYFTGKEFFGMSWVTFALMLASAIMLFISIPKGGKKFINKEVHNDEKESVQNSL